MAMSAVYRKSSIDSDSSPMESRKLSRFNYYFKLESESSLQSDDDTESIHSIQEKETDYVKDTSDTDTTITRSDIEEENQIIEYEVASPSDSDADIFFIDSSTDTDQEYIIAAAICGDGPADTYVTDIEDSAEDDSSTSAAGLLDFPSCIQCKSEKNNLQYRYCEKCFQDRKTFFPPRPRRNKKNPNKAKKTIQHRRQQQPARLPVRLDQLKSCLSDLTSSSAYRPANKNASSTVTSKNNSSPSSSAVTSKKASATITSAAVSTETMCLSQDSGLGSSQEFSSLDLDRIVVPEKYLSKETSLAVAPSCSSYGWKPQQLELQEEEKNKKKKDSVLPTLQGRKRNFSESSLSSEFDERPVKKLCKKTSDKDSGSTTKTKIGKDVSLTTSIVVVDDDEPSLEEDNNKKKWSLPLATRDDVDDGSLDFLDVAGVTRSNQKSDSGKSSSSETEDTIDIPTTRTETAEAPATTTTASTSSTSSATTASISNSSGNSNPASAVTNNANGNGTGTEEVLGSTDLTPASTVTTSANGGSTTGSNEVLGCTDMQAESKELCTMCNVARKNGIFVHGRDAHMCSCYMCAMRIWKTRRRCPLCNRKIHNVLRFFSS